MGRNSHYCYINHNNNKRHHRAPIKNEGLFTIQVSGPACQVGATPSDPLTHIHSHPCTLDAPSQTLSGIILQHRARCLLTAVRHRSAWCEHPYDLSMSLTFVHTLPPPTSPLYPTQPLPPSAQSPCTAEDAQDPRHAQSIAIFNIA